jgi:hypothetical protein
VRGVKLSPTLASVVMCSGIRATSPATTWAYLADTVSFRDLVRIGDAIVRIPGMSARGVCPSSSWRRRQSSRRGTGTWPSTPRHPSARARRDPRGRHVAAGDGLPASALGEALPEPVLDAEIRDASGRLLGIADALYKRYAVIVEIEGDHHRTSREQWLRDLQKHAAYAAAGYELVRLGARQIRGRGDPEPASCAPCSSAAAGAASSAETRQGRGRRRPVRTRAPRRRPAPARAPARACARARARARVSISQGWRNPRHPRARLRRSRHRLGALGCLATAPGQVAQTAVFTRSSAHTTTPIRHSRTASRRSRIRWRKLRHPLTRGRASRHRSGTPTRTRTRTRARARPQRDAAHGRAADQ